MTNPLPVIPRPFLTRPSLTRPLLTGACRAGATLLLAGIVTSAGVGLAEAHVRVFADSTEAGSFSALTFRVPNESSTAGTVKVSVQLPQDKPFLYVSSKPVPGWQVASTEETLPKPVTSEGTALTRAVRTVAWTADRGNRIEPGQYQEFSLSVGPLPAAGTVALPATQTYSDGQVMRWDQPAPATGEAEHPAPELVVTAGGSTGAGSPSPGVDPTAAPTSAPATASAAAPDRVARGLGIVALVVAAAGLAVAVAGRRRTPA